MRFLPSIRLRACGLALLFWPIAHLYAGEEPRAPGELLLGSVAIDTPAVMHQRLRPLCDYLSDNLDRPVRLRLSGDYNSAIDQLAKGQLDIAYLTPVGYIRAQKAGKVRLLAKAVTRGRGTFQLMLITRRDSGIRTVRDLAGRSFALGDEAATLQRAILLHAGMGLERLGSYRFLGHFDNVARGVMNGDFDAGILKDTTAFEWERKGLRIVYASPELPSYNIAVRAGMDPSTAGAILAALRRLDPDNPAHVNVIHALDENYDGFVPAQDADYDPIRKLVRAYEHDP